MMNRIDFRRYAGQVVDTLCLGLVTLSAHAQTQTQKQRAPKMWGDKNYNPEYFDLKPPVAQPLEGDRGAVQVLTPVAGRLAHAFYLYRPDHKLPDDPTWESAYDSYLAFHDLHVGQKQASTLTFPTHVPAPPKKLITHVSRAQIWYPRFSPDGRYLLFKYGHPTSSLGPNTLYVLDTQTLKMRRLPDPPPHTLNYEYVSWSPDSNYVAFVIGGDRYGQVLNIQGPDVVNIGPLTLYISEWRTGKWYEVARNDTIRGPFRWTAPHTLVYGLMPPTNDKFQNAKRPRPNLYEYSVEKQSSRIAMRDGFLPVPSPSGRLVAFFGAENTEAAALTLKEDWPDRPSNVALIVAPLPATGEPIVSSGFLSDQPWKAKERIVVNNEEHAFPEVFWLPDEKHLITLKQVQWGEMNPTTKDFLQINKAEVRLWDLTDALAGKGSCHYKLLATLTAQDYERAPRSPMDGAFRGLHISADGKTFYLVTSEFTGRDPLNGILYLNRTILKGVDVETGKVTDIAQTLGDVGIDWLENPHFALHSQ
jgi:hypothetical protein